MPRSWSHFTLVSPRRNHSSSPNTERVWIFLVVTRGKPARRSKRIWWPKTERVPVPVRSPFSTPSSRTRWRRSRYCCTVPTLVERHGSGDRRSRVATDPDLAVDGLHVHPAGPAERGALGGDVRRRQPGAGEPLPDARVERAGHRVLRHPVAGAERAQLGGERAVGVRPDDADLQVAERR